jgi:hypothetical protein
MSRFRLLVFATGVINVHAVSRRKEITYMKTFTIDNDNNIMVHASRKAARETGAGVFASEEQFAELIGPDNKRLVDIWNSLAGVKPVTKFANRKAATERIWKALQSLGEQPSVAPAAEPQVEAITDAIPAEFAAAEPEVIEIEVVPELAPEPEHVEVETERPLEDTTLQAEIEPVTLTPQDAPAVVEPVADAGAQEPREAPAEGTATDSATPAKKPRKAKKEPKAPKPESAAGPREGSKTAQVGRDVENADGSHAGRYHDEDGLAEAHGPRVHGWRDEEGRVYGRVLQIGSGSPLLPNQRVGIALYAPGPPGFGRRGLFFVVC